MPRRKSLPRPKAPKGTADQQRIEFSFHPNLSTSEGEVYQYLLRSPVWTIDQGKVMANDCILTRFLPYARAQTNPVLAKRTAQYSIQQLVRYIDELCRDFELDHPLMTYAPMSQHMTQAVLSPIVAAPTPIQPQAPVAPTDAAYGRFELFEQDE
jgi:hypothetical protein